MRIKVTILLAVFCITLIVPGTVLAQDPQPPTGSSPWGEVVDANGNVRYDNLTDLGEVQVSAAWMPSLPFINGQATYHEYLTPSGNMVVMPSASTLFFMALNPEASGINQANSALGNGIGAIETMLAGYIKPSDIANMGYTNPNDFFQAIIDGKENIWTTPRLSTLNFLTDLLSLSLSDQNLYTMLLLYTQNNCDAAPGGCQALPIAPPPVSSCPAPFIQTGPISITGGSGDGGKIAPPKPVVVGQDPDRRGVDIQVNVNIPPVIYHFFLPVQHQEESCGLAEDGSGDGCPGHPGDSNYRTVMKTWIECEEQTTSYTDRLAAAQISVDLTQESRQWILTNLAQAYPGAHLIHPDFSFSFGGGGASWSQVIPSIQTADPGNYSVNVSVRTSGTPVSAPRSAGAGLGEFLVQLVRVTLIGAP